ncbi:MULTISPECIES: hypothetical protein [unclassified Streptomyces]|uniref:hypothetical protein n=1 Tax=unclassified Streptomyces TaxID=2593676 RepID=UPI0004C55DE0|nr:hypothetical protein [Streptomyces sp. NRRL F-5727]
MDYAKLDPALSAAVEAGDGGSEVRNLLVTVVLEAAPTEAQRAVLRGAGVDAGAADRSVVSGTLSRRGVEELSHAPWVRSLTLSSSRRPL